MRQQLLTLIILLSLAACGDQKQTTHKDEAPAAAATETAVVPAAVEVVKEAVTEAAKQ